jgi:hypothetical protein
MKLKNNACGAFSDMTGRWFVTLAAGGSSCRSHGRGDRNHSSCGCHIMGGWGCGRDSQGCSGGVAGRSYSTGSRQGRCWGLIYRTTSVRRTTPAKSNSAPPHLGGGVAGNIAGCLGSSISGGGGSHRGVCRRRISVSGVLGCFCLWKLNKFTSCYHFRGCMNGTQYRKRACVVGLAISDKKIIPRKTE